MKEMLDVVHESAMSLASIYRWYKFKSGRKSAKKMGKPDAPTQH